MIHRHANAIEDAAEYGPSDYIAHPFMVDPADYTLAVSPDYYADAEWSHALPEDGSLIDTVRSIAGDRMPSIVHYCGQSDPTAHFCTLDTRRAFRIIGMKIPAH